MSDPYDANDSNPHSNDPGRIYTFEVISVVESSE
jgi:hypothetical protein